jgi:hypothetical protein
VIIRFRAAAGENDFLRARADQGRNLLPRRFDRGASPLPESVNRGSVSEFSGKKWEHRVEHVRLNRRGGIVIQIDAIHGHAIRIDLGPLDSKRTVLTDGKTSSCSGENPAASSPPQQRQEPG